MVGGNVETSQRVVDVLLGALGVAAASQGTMNNVLFGDATFGYYETICGGAGATPDGRRRRRRPHAHDQHAADRPRGARTPLPGPRARVLHPPRLGRGRRASRAATAWSAGLEFLADLDVSILSQRRGPYPPFGLAGGEPGALGRNTLQCADGRQEQLPGQVQFSGQTGDVLTIETPGGGGFGTSDA